MSSTPNNNVILLTGSTGTVGKHLLKALNELQAQPKLSVRLLIRDAQKAKELFQNYSSHLDIDYFEGDLQNQSTWDHPKLFENVERIFLLTLSTPKQVEVESAFITQAIHHGTSLKQIVRLSGLGASSEADSNSFFRLHSDSEKAISKLLKKVSLSIESQPRNISLVILKPNVFMQNFVRDDVYPIRQLGSFFRPKHDHDVPFSISHVDVKDIADITVQILTEPVEKHTGQTYNLTGPLSLTDEQLAQIISTTLGKEVKAVGVSEAEFYSTLVKHGLSHFHSLALIKLYQVYKCNGNTANVHGDFTIVTGKQPRRFEDFFKENKNTFL